MDAGAIEIRFKLPPNKEGVVPQIYANKAFAMTRAIDGALPDALFGHRQDGEALDYPIVRFDAGRGWFSLVGLGAFGKALLRDHWEQVYDGLLAKYAGQSVGAGTRCWPAVDVAPTEDRGFRGYWALNPVLITRGRDWLEWKRGAVDVEALIRKRIYSGIARQADVLGLVQPRFVVGNITHGTLVPVKEVQGRTRFALMARWVAFTANIELGGPWAVGALTGKGYGRVGRVTHEWLARRAA